MTPPYSSMDPAAKASWVAALRSGTYLQGRGRLVAIIPHDDLEGHDEFCCLGVLCDLDGETVWGNTSTIFDAEQQRYVRTKRAISGSDTAQAFLPDALAARLGVSEVAQEQLTLLNDRGSTFNEIADWIEENL